MHKSALLLSYQTFSLGFNGTFNLCPARQAKKTEKNAVIWRFQGILRIENQPQNHFKDTGEPFEIAIFCENMH
ncbi:hypothetical protein [Pseudodesulfovibrio sp. zrk46]|uniref:hypothetical protein n=1 Tax=Pseudodesulfovibrio sp. zrk46 TaxID=2725288 RepID=UPI001449517F|nr:hypothetical protein [Pseudodesulfovibrio sp. zrk46]QJB57676.1 hypothetical protein HFN16_15245 [Pseudodesulfovibrio sp. zrk46]